MKLTLHGSVTETGEMLLQRGGTSARAYIYLKDNGSGSESLILGYLPDGEKFKPGDAVTVTIDNDVETEGQA